MRLTIPGSLILTLFTLSCVSTDESPDDLAFKSTDSTTYLDAKSVLSKNEQKQRKTLAAQLVRSLDEVLPAAEKLPYEKYISRTAVLKAAEALSMSHTCKKEDKVRAYLPYNNKPEQPFFLISTHESNAEVQFSPKYLQKALYFNVLDLVNFENIDGDWEEIVRRAGLGNFDNSLLTLSLNSAYADSVASHSVVVVELCPGRVFLNRPDIFGDEELDSRWKISDKNIFTQLIHTPLFILPEEVVEILPKCIASKAKTYSHCSKLKVNTSDSSSTYYHYYLDKSPPSSATKLMRSAFSLADHEYEYTLFAGPLWAEKLSKVGWQLIYRQYVDNFGEFIRNFYFEDNYSNLDASDGRWVNEVQENKCEAILKIIEAHTVEPFFEIPDKLNPRQVADLTGVSLFKVHNSPLALDSAQVRWDLEKNTAYWRRDAYKKFSTTYEEDCLKQALEQKSTPKAGTSPN